MSKVTYVADGTMSQENAQRYGEAIIAIHERKPAGIYPRDVVEDARKDTSVLHDAFEWDDSVAGEKYRIEQAGQLLRTIKVQFSKYYDEPIRAFISINLLEIEEEVEPGESTRVNRRVEQVMNNDVQRTYIMKQLQKELRSFERRLRRFEEFGEVVDSIQKYLKRAA